MNTVLKLTLSAVFTLATFAVSSAGAQAYLS